MKLYPSKKVCSRSLMSLTLALTTQVWLGATAAKAVTFKFNPAHNTPQAAIDGFAAAGSLWSALFNDPVTVNLDISFGSLDPADLGNTSTEYYFNSYSAVRAALTQDITSTDDAIAVSNLPQGSSFRLLTNYTSNNPNGSGSPTPYLDQDGGANNSNILMTKGNAKALGLLAGNSAERDATIAFNSQFNWDFNRTDGIAAGAYDFVGAAAHEIGHTLGFLSGVDVLDFNSPYTSNGTPYFFPDNTFTFVSPMDLFRYSRNSVAYGKGVIDWTASSVDKYFSTNGGIKKLASFATGANHGDGYQAGHWKDNLNLGMMDPTGAQGELLQVSSRDIQLFDVIGWNLAGPSTSGVLPASLTSSSQTGAKNPSAAGAPTSTAGSLALSPEAESSTSVPEPASLVGLLVIGMLGLSSRLQQQVHKLFH